MIPTSTLRRLLTLAAATCLLAAATPAAAERHARLSTDLAEKLARGDQDIDVIVEGSRGEVDAVAGRYNLRVKRYLRSGAVLRVNAGQLDALQADQSVTHLSSDAPVRSTAVAADVTRQTIGADQVWTGVGKLKALTGKGVSVAVIDSGVAFSHPALAGKVVASVDFTGGDGVDRFGHGTHVAALIAGTAGKTPDTAGYGGIAPDAGIVSLRVLDANGAGQMSAVVDALDWAIEHQKVYGIKVINLSLGAAVLQPAADDPLCQAAARAVASGMVVVAASGNFGLTAEGLKVYGGITSPGNSPAVITVGALDTNGTATRLDDKVAKFSSEGPTLFDYALKPDLVAPGRNVVSAEAPESLLAAQHPERHVTAGYMSLSGSSMATAVVSGAVALLADRRPNLSPTDARIVLQATASFMPGAGLVASGAGSLDAVTAARLTDSSWFPQLTSTNALNTHTLTSSVAKDLSLIRAISAAKQSDTIVWGQGATIVWGQGATIVWGQGATIVWGQKADDTIVWGQAANDTIVWGQTNSDTIVWGQAGQDTIVWGQASQDTIVWGQGAPDTIVWGQGAADTIVWGQGLQDTIIWGQSNDTIVWGQ